MKGEVKSLAEKVMKELQEGTGLKRVAEIWTQLSKKDLLALDETKMVEARLLSDHKESVASLVQPLMTTMATPMLRVSGIFLQQLQDLGSLGFQPMQEQQLCSWQMPSACTNLGVGFFSFLLLQLPMLLVIRKVAGSA